MSQCTQVNAIILYDAYSKGPLPHLNDNDNIPDVDGFPLTINIWQTPYIMESPSNAVSIFGNLYGYVDQEQILKYFTKITTISYSDKKPKFKILSGVLEIKEEYVTTVFAWNSEVKKWIEHIPSGMILDTELANE